MKVTPVVGTDCKHCLCSKCITLGCGLRATNCKADCSYTIGQCTLSTFKTKKGAKK